jgi:carboxylesterase type B
MQAAPDSTPVLAPTTSGTVQGAWHHGVARFAGIPYAAPADLIAIRI